MGMPEVVERDSIAVLGGVGGSHILAGAPSPLPLPKDLPFAPAPLRRTPADPARAPRDLAFAFPRVPFEREGSRAGRDFVCPALLAEAARFFKPPQAGCAATPARRSLSRAPRPAARSRRHRGGP